MHQVQPYVIRVIRDWCAALGDDGDSDRVEWSSPKDMKDWAAYVVFDSLGELLMGRSYETIQKSENRWFLEMMVDLIKYNNFVGQMPSLAKLGLAPLFIRGQKERRSRQVKFARDCISTRLEQGPDANGRRDILYHLSQAKDPETGNGFSQQELTSETVLLLGAGSDTANTAMTTIWFFLAHHPDVLARLTESIRSSFSSVEDISSGHTVMSNTYLRACMDENMRLCPPVPMLLPREILPGGMTVCGEKFDEGVTIGVPTYALHHSAQYFDRPFEYDPGRWLPKQTDALKLEGSDIVTLARQRAAFAPFSIGPRACIGRKMALLELYVGVARVLFLYDIRLQPGTENVNLGPGGEYRMKDHFIVGKEGPMIQFRPHFK